ncbi:hypothetical protein GGI15_002083 [Coemansia interrupta]|uniref:Uncharacterized protein n=1 Tax=Coemansia interrupta TaxID=1126814 RepID=A0A9W8HEX0_9FUNG|nr:hypothetical protein GGI15_002083 [Coemansia interrupta]
MAPGNRIRKLSLQVKERLNSLKRQKRSNSVNDHIDDIEIVHPHFDENEPIKLSVPRDSSEHNSLRVNTYGSPRAANAALETQSLSGGDTYVGSPLASAIPDRSRFSRDEWQKKADLGLFGSTRSRLPKSKASDVTADDSEMTPVAEMPPPLQPHPPQLVKFPQLSDSEIDARRSVGIAPIQRSCSAESSDSSMSMYGGGIGALNELLFATNSHIEFETRSLVQQCIRDFNRVSSIVENFERTVNEAYKCFAAAALAVFAVDRGDTTYGSISHIVDMYCSGKMKFQRPDSGYIGGSAGKDSNHALLVLELQRLDIPQVKYSKEQMRLYAVTGLSKYVTSQVLLSTGIENDLVDKMGDASEALNMTVHQIDILNSLGSQYVESENSDTIALRAKADAYQATIDRLRQESEEASVVRHTFETVLLRIQSL